jgi:hypothetical protein
VRRRTAVTGSAAPAIIRLATFVLLLLMTGSLVEV